MNKNSPVPQRSPHLAPALVTFELHTYGSQTEVCLVHSGREHLPETFSSVLDQGWGYNMLRRLAELIEQE
ncbi:MAG: SRPBCC domain-containing protein [Chloroflexota bacterium]|nr:SRPBCC domain-containing protein [Chloroflexota bacterium]